MPPPSAHCFHSDHYFHPYLACSLQVSSLRLSPKKKSTLPQSLSKKIPPPLGRRRGGGGVVAPEGARGAARRGCRVTTDTGHGPHHVSPVAGAAVSYLCPSLFPSLFFYSPHVGCLGSPHDGGQRQLHYSLLQHHRASATSNTDGGPRTR
jgi:hypothetical protein